jgi:hypothetical protein
VKLEESTKQLIRRLQPSAPVDITAIAKVLGLAVWEKSDLPSGIAGKLLRDDKHGGTGNFSIIVRAQDPFARKRFTVAHEIAHYLLHRNLFVRELIDDALYRSGLSTSVEAEANGLAADLLMPWHLLTPLVDRPIPDLASLFGVSQQAMSIRLKSHLTSVGRTNLG